jgi:malate dehydrogenase (oxaloacetate-decarboxylating)
MKMAAAEGIAALIAEADITEEYVIPSPFDPRVAEAVAKAVSEKAIEQGLARI